jgi:hypothetical protein
MITVGIGIALLVHAQAAVRDGRTRIGLTTFQYPLVMRIAGVVAIVLGISSLVAGV